MDREREKFGHLAQFGKALAVIRKRVRADLARRGLPKEKVLALIVSLLDRTHLRLGNPQYVKANNSFGLSTLLTRHVRIVSGVLRMRFRGKSGKWHERRVSDQSLVRIVRSCRDLPGQALFQYRTANGTLHCIGSVDVNMYIIAIAGGHFTAKDFRTWAGSVTALSKLTDLPTPGTKTQARKTLVAVYDHVAAELGNTRAVCRKSYIHPSVPRAFLQGTLPSGRKCTSLSAAENSLLRLLRRQTSNRIDVGATLIAVA